MTAFLIVLAVAAEAYLLGSVDTGILEIGRAHV